MAGLVPAIQMRRRLGFAGGDGAYGSRHKAGNDDLRTPPGVIPVLRSKDRDP
jgi:hypothetical protein